MNKVDSESLKIIDLNRKKLSELFPNVVKEGKIDFEQLKNELGEYLNDNEEKYEFTWNGKREALKIAQMTSTGTLLPLKNKSIDWDNTSNIYIEGDNLEVLKILQKSYNRRIKMIYIDPPYNTGNDFIYKDNFSDSIKNYKEITGQTNRANAESEGRFHTDWLNMIYPRLELSKNLLREDGVIFISIDDNEQANLKKICDEVFGIKNFIGTFCVNSTPNARDYGHIGKMHEYILFYAKNIDLTQTNMILDKCKDFKYVDEKSGFNIHPLYNSNEAFTNKNRPNLYYPFYVNPNNPSAEGFYEISLEKNEGWIEIYPPKSLKNEVQFVWRWGKEEKARKNLNKEIVGYKVDNEFRIVQKMRNNSKIIRSILIDKNFTTRKGTAEVEEILGEKIFSFPKPVELIKLLCMSGLSDDDIVLDFFSGSGTTGQAVYELNNENDTHNKFILVQLPGIVEHEKYNTICDIAENRIAKISDKYKNLDNFDNGFKVFKLDSSNIKVWNGEELDADKANQYFLEHVDPIVKGRTDDDLLYEILLKEGMMLSSPVEEKTINNKKIYSVGLGYMIVCLDNEIDTELVREIGKLKPETVIFKDSGFKDENAKANALQELKKLGIEKEKVKSI